MHPAVDFGFICLSLVLGLVYSWASNRSKTYYATNMVNKSCGLLFCNVLIILAITITAVAITDLFIILAFTVGFGIYHYWRDQHEP